MSEDGSQPERGLSACEIRGCDRSGWADEKSYSLKEMNRLKSNCRQ